MFVSSLCTFYSLLGALPEENYVTLLALLLSFQSERIICPDVSVPFCVPRDQTFDLPLVALATNFCVLGFPCWDCMTLPINSGSARTVYNVAWSVVSVSLNPNSLRILMASLSSNKAHIIVSLACQLSASATALTFPGWYYKVKSYCSRNSIQRLCHMFKSFWAKTYFKLL